MLQSEAFECRTNNVKTLLDCRSTYPNLHSEKHVVTDAKQFNLETGILDPRKNTFRVITIENRLEAETEKNVYYYISQESDLFKMFLDVSQEGEVTSFEKDL